LALLDKLSMPQVGQALPGRPTPVPVAAAHYVNGAPLQSPFPAQMRQVIVGMGCFWGAERKFWELPGVYSTAVGYAGGVTPNPTYEEVCSGRTGHTEVVLVVYDTTALDLTAVMKCFWENHDPTQGMRQGNDRGTQYRSAVYTLDETELELVNRSLALYQTALTQSGYGAITTEVSALDTFYYAEDYHQQYLAKVPNGYCGIGGTGVGCDMHGLVAADG